MVAEVIVTIEAGSQEFDQGRIRVCGLVVRAVRALLRSRQADCYGQNKEHAPDSGHGAAA